MRFFSDTYWLFRRGFRQSLRPYIALMPELLMPVFFFIVNSAGFQAVVDIPGFTAESYLAFYAPVALLMGIFFSSGSTGIEVVTDISTGYMDRMFLTPVRRISIVLGKLLSTGVRAIIQATLMLIVLVAFGAPFSGGIVGLLALYFIAFVFGMGWSAIGMTLAFLTQNPRTVQSSFILFFPFTFVTTSQLPINLLDGIYRDIVLINPVTYLLEGIREIMLIGFGGPATSNAIIASVAITIITVSMAFWSFRSIIK